MRNTIIHIGANKTASTTLQRALFAKSKNIYYVGEDGIGYSEYSDSLNSLIYDDDLHYNAAHCKELFESHLNSEKNKTFVFSSEDVLTSQVPVTCARRLHNFMPQAKILLVIRNQYTAVPSFYANHGAFLKPAPPSYFRKHVSFLDWMVYQELFIKYGALASFKYNTLISIYEELFGSENIHIFLFEEFQQDKKSFSEKLSILLKIDTKEILDSLEGKHERKRYTGRMLAYNKFRTYFFWGVKFSQFLPFGSSIAKAFSSFLEKGKPAKIQLTEKIKEKIFKIYANENAKLSKKYSLNLGKYGYPMAPVDNIPQTKDLK